LIVLLLEDKKSKRFKLSLNTLPKNSINRDFKILFISDNAVSHLTVSGILSPLIDKYDTISNLTQTFEELDNKQCDCILVEIDLIENKKWQFLNKLKQRKTKTPIVILTNYSSAKYLIDLIHYGISGVIQKPIEKNELLKTISKVSKGSKIKDL
jgi:DNA-binding NarL/FixJ family response regulator